MQESAGDAGQLAGMVNYQEDSIVSRTLIGRPTGSVTLFAFDKGQTLSEHMTPFDALVILLDGQADITVAGKQTTAKEGDLVKLPANVPHALTASQRFKMLLVMIR